MLFIDSRELLLCKLDLLDVAIRDIGISIFAGGKKLSDEYSSILLDKIWETSELEIFSVCLLSFYCITVRNYSRSYDIEIVAIFSLLWID